jgi:hypothetical protein
MFRCNFVYNLVVFIGTVTSGIHARGSCPYLVHRGEWKQLKISPVFSGFGAKLEFVQEVVSKAISYWESVLRVRHLSGARHTIKSRSITCGMWDYFAGSELFYPESYGGEEKSDLVINFTQVDGLTKAYGVADAMVCTTDMCGRPLHGRVRMTKRTVETYNEIDLLSTTLHEMGHVLGFTIGQMLDWIDPSNGTPLFDDSNTVRLTYLKKYDESAHFVNFLPRLPWDYIPIPFYGEIVWVDFPGEYIDSVTRRGLGDDCSCPVDPSRTYTDAELTECFQSRYSCILEVSSPKVVAAARSYFNCPHLTGMELTASPSSPSTFIQSHWKSRTLHGELMNPEPVSTTRFISPMTLAFLDDSGWYQVDYSRATSGDVWGNQSGCDVILKPCYGTEEDTTYVLSVEIPEIFSEKNGCVADFFSYYQAVIYGIRDNDIMSRVMADPETEGCPMVSEKYGSCIKNQSSSSRCLLYTHGSSNCVAVHCISETAYKFEVVYEQFSGICNFGGQIIGEYICQDPVKMCRTRQYHHYNELVTYNINQPPIDEKVNSLPAYVPGSDDGEEDEESDQE